VRLQLSVSTEIALRTCGLHEAEADKLYRIRFADGSPGPVTYGRREGDGTVSVRIPPALPRELIGGLVEYPPVRKLTVTGEPTLYNPTPQQVFYAVNRHADDDDRTAITLHF
jgi:hypothetical protein